MFASKNCYQDVGAIINNRNSPELLMLLLCQAEKRSLFSTITRTRQTQYCLIKDVSKFVVLPLYTKKKEHPWQSLRCLGCHISEITRNKDSIWSGYTWHKHNFWLMNHWQSYLWICNLSKKEALSTASQAETPTWKKVLMGQHAGKQIE